MLFMVRCDSRCAKAVHKYPLGTHSAVESCGQVLIFYKKNYLARPRGSAGFPSVSQTLNKTSIF